MGNLILLFGAAGGAGISLHLLFSKLRLRRRLAAKMMWWTPGVILILFVLTGILLVRLFSFIDPASHAEPIERIIEGVFLGLWLASVPVVSPNPRWDKQ